MTEVELIHGLIEKNEQSYKYFVTTYQDRIFNTILSIIQHHEDAEDLTQQVFIQVIKSIAQFKQQSSILTWVYAIACNKSKDYLRAKKLKQTLSFVPIFSSSGSIEPSEFQHPGIQLEQKEAATTLFKLLAKLPTQQKQALVLKKIEGLSQQQIAEIMQITEGAVEGLLYRAKQQLKKWYNHEYKS